MRALLGVLVVLILCPGVGAAAANEPAGTFDCNANRRVDFANAARLFNHL